MTNSNKKNKLPVLFEFILRIILSEEFQFRLTDFEEIYFNSLQKKGKLKTAVWFFNYLLKNMPHLIYNNYLSGGIMIRNYFLISIRNLLKNKLFSAINIFGLAAGIACTILILLWVQDETSFDNFHEKSQSIFRVVGDWEKWNWDGFEGTPGILSPIAKETIPEIKNSVRFDSRARSSFKYGEKVFYEEGGIYSDKSLFEIFSFKIKSGDLNNAFASPGNVLISEKIAFKYFGTENPLGKTVQIEGEDFNVAAVFFNPPSNSHLQFDFINSFEKKKIELGREFSWDAFNYVTYLEIPVPENAEIVGHKLTELGLANNSAQVSQGVKFRLESIGEIYLNPRSYNRSFVKLSNSKYVYIFFSAAMFILLIACVNFMNLTTAKAANRAREIGMRKALGAARKQLIYQFYTETFILTLISFLIGLIIVKLSLPAFNSITDKSLTLDLLSGQSLSGLLLIGMMVTIISGIYPALYLSSFAPTLVLKGEITKSKKAAIFRKVMVVFQFTISIVLIIGTAILYNQYQFIRNKNLGFDKENIISIPMKENLSQKYQAVKNSLLNKLGIISVTGHTNDFSSTSWHTTVQWKEADVDQTIDLVLSGIDYDFFKTMEIKINTGRGFSEEFVSEQNNGAYIINDAAIKKYGLKNPVGRIMPIPGWENQIIGVANDVHFKSLHEEISPRLYYISDFSDAGKDAIMLIRIKGDNIPQTIAGIEEVWNTFNQTAPFEFNFLDEKYNLLYKSEERTAAVINSFTLIAVLISCLGLFGLSSFMIEKRRKEIGIKKVLGATKTILLKDILKQFFYWILIASALAYPAAYLIGVKFLDEYAYKIEMGAGIFLISTLAVLLFAMLTVFFQTLKAALANPVESLKYE